MQLLPNLDRTACTAHNALDTEDDAHERSNNRPCPARIWRGPLDRRRRFRNDGLAASDSAFRSSGTTCIALRAHRKQICMASPSNYSHRRNIRVLHHVSLGPVESLLERPLLVDACNGAGMGSFHGDVVRGGTAVSARMVFARCRKESREDISTHRATSLGAVECQLDHGGRGGSRKPWPFFVDNRCRLVRASMLAVGCPLLADC